MVDDDRYHRPESPQFSLYWIATTDRYISFLGLRQYSRAPQQQTGSGEARRKWMVVPTTDLRTLKIYPKRQLDNYSFDRNGKVLLLENDHKNDGN